MIFTISAPQAAPLREVVSQFESMFRRQKRSDCVSDFVRQKPRLKDKRVRRRILLHATIPTSFLHPYTSRGWNFFNVCAIIVVLT